MRFSLVIPLLLLCMAGKAQKSLQLQADDSSLNLKNVKNAAFKRSLVIPLSLIVAGVFGTTNHKIIDKYEIKEERDEHMIHFHTKLDNQLQFAPILLVFGMDALGFKGEHDVWNQAGLFLKSELLMTAITFPVKKYSHVIRPDSSSYTSFPSGHTAQAFLAAEFLRKEYGRTHPWLAVSGYFIASSVGVLRMMNNKHWLPDVLAGAGIGILSVDLVYLTHKNKWPFWQKKLQVSPTYTGYGPGIYLNYHFGK